jgi:hypothetical protein
MTDKGNPEILRFAQGQAHTLLAMTPKAPISSLPPPQNRCIFATPKNFTNSAQKTRFLRAFYRKIARQFTYKIE